MVVAHLFSLHLFELLSLVSFLSSYGYLSSPLSGVASHLAPRTEEDITRAIIMNNLLDYLSTVRVLARGGGSSTIHRLNRDVVVSYF